MSCCVCDYKLRSSLGKRSLFSLPKDEKLREKWLMRLPEYCRSFSTSTTVSVLKVCCSHFSESDFEILSSVSDSKSRRRLKKGTVPSKLLGAANSGEESEERTTNVSRTYSSITPCKVGIPEGVGKISAQANEVSLSDDTCCVDAAEQVKEMQSSCLSDGITTFVTESNHRGSDECEEPTQIMEASWSSMLPSNWKLLNSENEYVKFAAEMSYTESGGVIVAKSARIDFMNLSLTKYMMGAAVISTESEHNPAPFYGALDLKVMLKSFVQQKPCAGLDSTKYAGVNASCVRVKKVGNTLFSSSCHLLADRCLNHCVECRNLKVYLQNKLRRVILVSRVSGKRTALKHLSADQLRERCQEQAKEIEVLQRKVTRAKAKLKATECEVLQLRTSHLKRWRNF